MLHRCQGCPQNGARCRRRELSGAEADHGGRNTKLKRLIFLILGCICLTLGCVGIVLPVLPTAPFFLITVFCFSQSSEKLHQWFLSTQLYQKNLASYVKR